MEFDRPSTAPAPEQDGDNDNSFYGPHPLEADDVPAFRGEQDISKNSALEEFLDNGEHLTIQALHDFAAPDILYNWDRAKANYYLGAESYDQIDYYAEKYGTADDYSGVNESEATSQHIGSDADFANIVVWNMEPGTVGQHWHDFIQKGIKAENYDLLMTWGSVDRRHFAEHLDLLTDEEIARLPEDYVDQALYSRQPNGEDHDDGDFLLRAYFRGPASEYGTSHAGFDTPSSETVQSLLDHGADPYKLATAMAEAPHQHSDADLYGWGMQLVGKNLATLTQYGFDVKQFANQYFDKSGDLYEYAARGTWSKFPEYPLRQFTNEVPELIRAGASAKDLFEWAQPLAETAHELDEKSRINYRGEIEACFADTLDVAIQRGEATKEMLDFLFQGPEQYAGHTIDTILQNLPILATTENLTPQDVVNKLIEYRHSSSIAVHFDDFVQAGVDPSGLAADLVAINFSYTDSITPNNITDKLNAYGMQLDTALTATKAAAADPQTNIWYLKQYDSRGIHIDARELLSHWPANDDSTYRAIHENIGMLVDHGLTQEVIDSLVDDQGSHRDLVYNLRNELAEYNRAQE